MEKAKEVMEEAAAMKNSKKEPCAFCGADTYLWAAIPTDDDTGAALSATPDACSMCHDYDKDGRKLIPKQHTLN